MINAIQEIGIIPFSKNSIPGWSIQEITDPDYWFTTSDQLGPWDWKVDAVQEGIIYGKFINSKSAFATVEYYRHLMNWRRSLSKFQIPVGGKSNDISSHDKLIKYLSPTLLSIIRERETLEAYEIRLLLDELVPVEIRKKVGGSLGKHLLPNIKKQIVETLLQYLDMGTWTVVGDITRVYRGPNCEYKGWQKNSITTPDLLFEVFSQPSENPFWVKYLVLDNENEILTNCTPENSREFLIEQIEKFYPNSRSKLIKVI